MRQALARFASDYRTHHALAPSSCFVRLSGAEPSGSFSIVSIGTYNLGELRRSVFAGVALTLIVLYVLTQDARLAVQATFTVVLTLITYFGWSGWAGKR